MHAIVKPSQPQDINTSYTSITDMESVVTKAKKWGNSIGVIIPKEVAEREGIKEGNPVELMVRRPRNPIKETFGILKGKFKKSTDELMRETDKELYNE